jgi:hypothetical protein
MNGTRSTSRQSLSSSSSRTHETAPTPIEGRDGSPSANAASSADRPDQPPQPSGEQRLQKELSDDEVTQLRACLQTWQGLDLAMGNSRAEDIAKFHHREDAGEIQVDGKNVIFISNGEPPLLPPALAEQRDLQGNLLREARVRFVHPQPAFGQLESVGSAEHKGEHGSSAPTILKPFIIVTPASPPMLGALASTTPRDSASSPRGSADISVSPRGSDLSIPSRGSISARVKQWLRKPEPTTSPIIVVQPASPGNVMWDNAQAPLAGRGPAVGLGNRSPADVVKDVDNAIRKLLDPDDTEPNRHPRVLESTKQILLQIRTLDSPELELACLHKLADGVQYAAILADEQLRLPAATQIFELIQSELRHLDSAYPDHHVMRGSVAQLCDRRLKGLWKDLIEPGPGI